MWSGERKSQLKTGVGAVKILSNAVEVRKIPEAVVAEIHSSDYDESTAGIDGEYDRPKSHGLN
jgi:hypothetical protein